MSDILPAMTLVIRFTHFSTHMEAEAMKFLAAGLCMGLGAIGPALGEGFVAAKAMEAMGRNPSVADKMVPNMIVAMAICESTGIYSLVISLILLFVV